MPIPFAALTLLQEADMRGRLFVRAHECGAADYLVRDGYAVRDPADDRYILLTDEGWMAFDGERVV